MVRKGERQSDYHATHGQSPPSARFALRFWVACMRDGFQRSVLCLIRCDDELGWEKKPDEAFNVGLRGVGVVFCTHAEMFRGRAPEGRLGACLVFGAWCLVLGAQWSVLSARC